jgi:hypothetical protein
MTGGVAIQIGLARLGRAGTRDTIADLDMVATAVDAISPRVAETFLVSHYHSVRPGVPKFMVQLVDPRNAVRSRHLSRSSRFDRALRGGRSRRQRDPFAFLSRTSSSTKFIRLSTASAARPVDPKHADDAHALGELFQRPVPAIDRDALVEEISTDWTSTCSCQRCVLSSSDGFPLAPKDEICRLLGWTRQAV